ncbi:hypothetical protein PsW74_05645 [Pseudovibrio sp. W74]|nr:hypothetical protein PsW74_05645 [Pseudovibrio sp. W74]
MDFGHDLAHLIQHGEYVCSRRGLYPNVHCCLTGIEHGQIIIFRSQLHPAHITQANDCAIAFCDNKLTEIFNISQVGVGREFHLHHLAFGVAHTGDKVIAGQSICDIRAGEAIGGQFIRVQPCTDCKAFFAVKLSRLHTIDCLNLWLDNTDDVIR